jgi:glucose/arabinose dehydrogenase
MNFKWILLLALLVSACAPTPIPTPKPIPATAPIETALPTQRATSTAVVANTPSPAPTLGPTPSNRSISIELEPVVSGITNPTNLVSANDDSARLFVTSKPGRIQIISNDQLITQPFLDISDRVLSSSYERGLLGLAFSPNYTTDRFFYVDYTRRPDGATIIARYSVSKDKPNTADASSEVILLKIDQPEPNHNGGQIAFGPDGYLYIGLGDGGGGGDRHGSIGNGQNLKALLGKILRIDVSNPDRYAIPASNPFGDEIWAYGLRNPWRFSFDRATGDLYIGDVGQNAYEEINFQPAASRGGENYGWRIMEGTHCYNPSTGCNQTGLTLPIAEYSHDFGCSVTGGSVYRGPKYPQLNGLYFFADFCSGTLWTLQRDARGEWQMINRLEAGFTLSSFGEDQSGELYVLGFDDDSVYRLVAR